MARSTRDKTADLELLDNVKQRPYDYDLFGLLRYLETMHDDKPRLGQSQRLSEDCIYLRQRPSTAFAPATIADFIPGYKRTQDQLGIFSFGVFGPNGALPLHLTEYASERLRQHKDPTFAAFADVFHHRAISLFYRAHVAGEPALGMDRPKNNPFDDYVGALAGIYVSEQERGERQLHQRLFYAGLFALKTRPADGLETLLTEAYGVEFQVKQFESGRLALRNKDKFCLGNSDYAIQLGVNTHLGDRVFDCQHRFSISAKLEEFQKFIALTPNGNGFSRLRSLVIEYVGLNYAWDLNLRLAAKEAPQWRLGESGDIYLGWSIWLGNVPADADFVDVKIDAEPPVEEF